MASSATPPISSNAAAVLGALLEARTGQQLASYRSWRLDTALIPLLRERGLDTLDQLVALLLSGRDPAIGDRIVDALVNGESSFFRDSAVFDQLVEVVAEHEAAGHRVRLWSAGCATGQEPLSLAMLFAERQGEQGGAMPEIVATDVSEQALVRARAARFTQFEIQRGVWHARPELVRMIQFRRQNLVADRAPPGRFDLILCRNVLIYLSPPTKARVFETLAQALRPGGTLVLGAGETVIGHSDAFEPCRRFRGFYRRVGGEEKLAAA